MATEGSVYVPTPFAKRGCVICEEIDTKMSLMTSESRGVLARQLQALADDIRRMEARLAENKPLFVHQDCLKPPKLSMPSALHSLPSER